MILAEVLPRIDHSVQICFHKVSYDIDIVVVSFRLRSEDIYQSDNVIVLEKFFIKISLLNSLISRTILLASIRSSKALMTWIGWELPF